MLKSKGAKATRCGLDPSPITDPCVTSGKSQNLWGPASPLFRGRWEQLAHELLSNHTRLARPTRASCRHCAVTGTGLEGEDSANNGYRALSANPGERRADHLAQITSFKSLNSSVRQERSSFPLDRPGNRGSESQALEQAPGSHSLPRSVGGVGRALPACPQTPRGPALRSASSPQVVGPQVALPPLGGSQLDEGAARGVEDAEDGDADAEDDHPVADDHPCGGSSRKQEVEVLGTPPWLTCSDGRVLGLPCRSCFWDQQGASALLQAPATWPSPCCATTPQGPPLAPSRWLCRFPVRC